MTESALRRLAPGLGGLVVWAALPAVLPRNFVDLLVFAGIYTIAGLGVGLLLGQCGIVNIAQATFYGIGAYASAYVTVTLRAPIVVGIVTGAVVAAVLAALIGWPILRLRGYFLGLATLALSVIGSTLFYEWDWLTGGALGIGGLPSLQLLGYPLDSPTRYYYVVWLVAFACMVLGRNLVRSRTGLMLRAMRDSAEAAVSLAIDLQWLRTRVFVLCAVLGSLAGSLFAHHVNYVSIDSFVIGKSITFLLIPMLGGVTSVAGIVVGALFVTFVPELLSRLGDFHQILFGLALVGVVVGLPGGLMGVVERVWRARAAGVATPRG
jgi:branched-chain amino acid transport system permease protein